MSSIEQTIYESSVDINTERSGSNTEDEAAITFGLIVGVNDGNGHISYASNEEVVKLVHSLLNKSLKEPFMDVTPNSSQELQVYDDNQIDDKNSNANKKHKSTIEDTSLKINHILDETAILEVTTSAGCEMQKIIKTEEFGLMSPMEVKGPIYAKNPIVFKYVRGLLNVRGLLKNPQESFIDVTNFLQEFHMDDKKHKKRKIDEAAILGATTPPDDEINQVQENTKAEKLDLIEGHKRGNGLLYANNQMMAKCAPLLKKQRREPFMDLTELTRGCSQEFLVDDNNRKTNKNMVSTTEGHIALKRTITI